MRDDRQLPIPQDWRLIDRIGSGVCGSVYRIEREQDGARAVLKVISIPMNEEEIPALQSRGLGDETINRVLESRTIEIYDKYQMLVDMRGETNIVSVGNVSYRRHADGAGCDVSILMEELTPLCDSLDHTFSEARVIAVGKDVLTALERYGQHRLIHGAVKPNNVLLADNGAYKLNDFGVSDLLGRRAAEICSDACDFMAPEIFLGKPYDMRADVYSVGLLLYWLCNDFRIPLLPASGDPLRSEQFEDAVARRMSGGMIGEPENGSRALKNIILRACAYDPKDRFSSAAAMLRELGKIAQPRKTTMPIHPIQIPEEKSARLYADPVPSTGAQGQPKPKPTNAQAHPTPKPARGNPIDLFENDEADPRIRRKKQANRNAAYKKKKGRTVGIVAAVCGLVLIAGISLAIALFVLTNREEFSGKTHQNVDIQHVSVTPTAIPLETVVPSATQNVTPEPLSTASALTDIPTESYLPIETPPSTPVPSWAPTPTIIPSSPTPTPSLEPTVTPTPAPTLIPVPAVEAAPAGAEHAFDGQTAQCANYKCCYINPSWSRFFSDADENQIADKYRLMRNTKVTVRALYRDFALIETRDGRTGWVFASFLYAAWMNDTYFNPTLTRQIQDGLETPLSYEILGTYLDKKTTDSKTNIRNNPYVAENMDPPEPDNKIGQVTKGTRFTVLAQRYVEGKLWYFCMKQAEKGADPVYCWVNESNFK